MKTRTLLILKPLTLVVSLGLLASCTTTPERVALLEQARVAVIEVDNDPMADQVAGNELEQARQLLARADQGLDEGWDIEVIEHDAYLALRHAEIAEQRIEEAEIRELIAESEDERNMVLLRAREREAQLAQSVADANAAEAERAKAMARQSAIEANRARTEAASATLTAQQLAEELEALKAEETERGLVLTLGDVLFDVDKAQLKPGAQNTLDRLAGFLNEHPDRDLLIEGHTDSTGASSYNMNLSSERANAVRDALIARNIDPGRLSTRGLGEDYPVATNDSVAGRQENRRVEIILSDQDGQFGQLR